MDGLFLELGPFKINAAKKEINLNPESWHKAANILFIDQPVGTGLSFTQKKSGLSKNDNDVNRHLHRFMLEFLKLHDRYVQVDDGGRRRSRNIFLTGESHAGHYIPSFAAYNQKINKNLRGDGITIQIVGLALGNPWVDPKNQYDVSEFAHGAGLISHGQRRSLQEMNKKCRSLLLQGKLNNKICFSLLDEIIDSSSVSGANKVLMYDSRKFVQSMQSFPPGKDAVESFLNRPEVRQAIHAEGSTQRYVECADPPYNALSHQDGKGVTVELVDLLDGGMNILFFSGQYDIICSHLGVEKSLRELPWSGKEGWKKAQPEVWLVDNQAAGYIKSYGSLSSLLGELPQQTITFQIQIVHFQII